jgi:hypothetical protein
VSRSLLNQFLDGRENPLKPRGSFEPREISPLHLKSSLHIRDGASPTTLRALALSFHRGIVNLLDNNRRVRLARFCDSQNSRIGDRLFRDAHILFLLTNCGTDFEILKMKTVSLKVVIPRNNHGNTPCLTAEKKRLDR